ncbi:hypothetical protein VZ95_09815 [Elstera litoralis]|uniref:Uncharacterized protein n=1 Tax=Elstera litoralis TaxID=552518 RepID=A0A0F3IT30_9PROT|nr:hypothetical protein [Elstera litoralis]KJV09703.1 hypothetical protein VZ95_09815 [Elstera litoralis]
MVRIACSASSPKNADQPWEPHHRFRRSKPENLHEGLIDELCPPPGNNQNALKRAFDELPEAPFAFRQLLHRQQPVGNIYRRPDDDALTVDLDHALAQQILPGRIAEIRHGPIFDPHLFPRQRALIAVMKAFGDGGRVKIENRLPHHFARGSTDELSGMGIGVEKAPLGIAHENIDRHDLQNLFEQPTG